MKTHIIRDFEFDKRTDAKDFGTAWNESHNNSQVQNGKSTIGRQRR
jgi:hypothetical protein